MNKSKIFLIVIWLFISTFQVLGQKDALKRANDFFDNGQFQNALIELSNIPNTESSGPLTFKRAICLYELNKLDEAIAEFRKSESIGYKNDDSEYYKGRTMHFKGQFDIAIEAYKSYLKKIDIDHPKRKEVREHIRHAGAAKDIIFIEPNATIENPGRKINSVYDDHGCIESNGKSGRYYFNTNRPDRNNKVRQYLNSNSSIDEPTDEKVFFFEKSKEELRNSEKLTDNSINTYKHDILIGTSQDGNEMFIARGKIGEPIADYTMLSQNPKTHSNHRLEKLTNITGIDADYHFFNDSTLVFASNTLGGYGGYDLFVTIYANNSWTNPKNLGRQINSSSDERFPYLCNDGTKIYFSSNRRLSVGGHDVFHCEYLYEQKIWGEPKNIGLPINSPGNEIQFRISNDGLMATYTSDRKDGIGKKDIYIAYLNEEEEHQSFKVKNLGFVDYPSFYIGKDDDFQVSSQRLSDQGQYKIEANENVTTSIGKREITLPILMGNLEGEIFTPENTKKLEDFTSKLKSNSYSLLEIMSFTHSEEIAEYDLFLSIKNAERIKEELVQKGIDDNKIIIRGFGDYLPMIRNDVSQSSILMKNNRVQFKIHNPHPNLSIEEESPQIDKSLLNVGFEIYKTIIEGSVSYKIQIATVRQMYRGVALKYYNDVMVEKDKITGNYLYTIGVYDNFMEANSILRELNQLGITSLKIIAYVDGLRINEDEVSNYANDYPELKDYIRSVTFSRPSNN